MNIICINKKSNLSYRFQKINPREGNRELNEKHKKVPNRNRTNELDFQKNKRQGG